MKERDEVLFELADLFKMFSDSTRLRILHYLSEQELNVGDIASLLGMNQSAISHQLKYLKAANLVSSRRDGKNIYYALKDEHINVILKTGLEHVKE